MGTTEKRSLKARIISGSVVMLSGSTLTVAINLAYNVAVAHFLGPQGFGNANALYTLLTLMSAVTLSFQIVTAKLVATEADSAARDSAYRSLHKAAWASGLLTATMLVLFRQQITVYLDLPDVRLVSILSIGAAFYIPLGCRRGYIQGAFGFRKLATNLVFEGVSRLVGSLIMIGVGAGVAGVILANSAAMAIAYVTISPTLEQSAARSLSFEKAVREVFHAVVFFAGQVLINNCDIVLVKHFFMPADAGLYAAIAMVGRVTFAASSAVVNGMFPVIAASKKEDRKNLSLIGTALALVLAVGGSLALCLRVMPSRVWTLLFGTGFQIPGPHGFSYLLALYGVTTTVYCLSVVVMTYEMSYKIASSNWVQLLCSGVLIASILRWHDSLLQVIVVQLAILTVFFFAVTIPYLLDTLRSNAPTELQERSAIRLLSGLDEDEVISGFLQSEFQHSVYRTVDDTVRKIVLAPDFGNPEECRMRKILLDRRHRALWKELPLDTQWFHIEVNSENIDLIRVFPRAHWFRMARGQNFSAVDIVHRIEQKQNRRQEPFVAKIAELRERISAGNLEFGPVILIGSDASKPLTILDGNHRFVAGVMEKRLDRLTFVCGLSPNMTACCWYDTNVFSLGRYSLNLLRAMFQKP